MNQKTNQILIDDLYKRTSQGMERFILAKGRGQGTFLCNMTPFERRVIEGLVSDGRLYARIGEREAWIQTANN